MKHELDEALCRDFPLLYRDRHGDMRNTCMVWGFSCGDGWEPIIREASEKLETLIRAYIEENPNLPCRWCHIDKDAHDVGWWSSGRWEPDGQAKHYGCHGPSGYEASHPRAVQVKEKYGCYDEKTEVLTLSGWKFFRDVSFDDQVATLHDGHNIIYDAPTDIISYDYEGPMYHVKTRGVDLLVTPQHNLYVAKGTYWNGRYHPPKKVEYPFELATPDVYFGVNKRFKKDGVWDRPNVDTFTLPEQTKEWRRRCGWTRKIWNAKVLQMNSWLSFLGWYVAEGCTNLKKGEISIACNNTDGGKERQTIASIISAIGYPIRTCQEDRPALSFRLYDGRLARWLSKNCGPCSYEKRVPEFVKNLSAGQIRIFLCSLFAGDGHKTATAWVLSTVSTRLADDVQELILKSGETSSLTTRPPGGVDNDKWHIVGTVPIHEVNWMTKSGSHNTADKGLAPSSIECWEPYKGRVYCVSVPSHVIYVRRNGKPVWCGNSLRVYLTCHTDEMLAVIAEAEKKSVVTCEDCGKPGRRRNGSWVRTLCDFCAATDERV